MADDEKRIPLRENDDRQEQQPIERKALTKLQEIRQNVREDDSVPVGSLTLRKILGGDFLSASLVRRNIWLFVLVVLFMVAYVAVRYQCQQDLISIDKKERELKDAKYRALSSSSTLTERCRESQVLEVLRQNHDSLLHISIQPPYLITIPEQGFLSSEE